jgi:predicted dehydrogenase
MVPYIIARFLDAYVAQRQDFVNRVLAGDDPAVTIEDARRALAIGAAATQSLHEGHPITLEL